MLNKINKKQQTILSIIGIIIGVTILSSNYLKEKKNIVFEKMNLELYNQRVEEIAYVESQEQVEEVIIEEPVEEVEPVEEIDTGSTNYDNAYRGILEIPKVGLRRGFLDKYAKDNSVSKNIEVLKTSDYPDVDKGNFIIAAHSGNSSIAYFKELYRLTVGDVAYVYYDNVKYTYQITNIYTQSKTGIIGIYRNYEKTTLTLVTCTKGDKTTQTIYIAELINKENM